MQKHFCFSNNCIEASYTVLKQELAVGLAHYAYRQSSYKGNRNCSTPRNLQEVALIEKNPNQSEAGTREQEWHLTAQCWADYSCNQLYSHRTQDNARVAPIAKTQSWNLTQKSYATDDNKFGKTDEQPNTQYPCCMKKNSNSFKIPKLLGKKLLIEV